MRLMMARRLVPTRAPRRGVAANRGKRRRFGSTPAAYDGRLLRPGIRVHPPDRVDTEPSSTTAPSSCTTPPRVSTYRYERLPVQDGSFLAFEDPNSHMTIGATLVFEPGPMASAGGGVDVERVREHIGSRLHQIPRYRQRLAWVPVEGHPGTPRMPPVSRRLAA